MTKDFNQAGGGGGSPSPASSAAASSANAIQFGNVLTPDGGLTPMAGIILAAFGLLAFIALIVVAKK